MCAGASLFLVVCLLKNWRSFRAALRDTRSLLHMIVFGLLGVLLTQFSYITCISYTNAGIGTVLERLGLIIILFYICITVRRLPRVREALGVLLALAGVFLIATHGSFEALAIPPEGLFWGCMTAVAMACYTLIPVKPLAKWGSFIVTGIAMSTAGITSAIMLQPWNLDVSVSSEVIIVVAVMVVVGTFAAYLFYLQGVRDAGSMRAGLIGCLEPVSAIVISALWLHTPVSLFDIIGTVLILSMVALTTQKDKNEVHDKFSGSLRDVPLFQGSASHLGYYETHHATSADLNAFTEVIETGRRFVEASPAMSEFPADLEDLLKYAGGLLINIGTLTDENWKLYQAALKIAEKYNVPAVLDPVACGAGEYRKKVADDLINNYKLAAIRGNAGEIASLVGINVASKGVDSAGVDNIDEIALAANKKFNIPIVVTGEVDAIAVNGEVVTIHNGSAMMPKVIGTGCLLGAVVASFIGLEKGQELKSLETAMLVYNIAGEMAEKRPNGHLPGTFKVEFINALYEITDEDVKEFKRVK